MITVYKADGSAAGYVTSGCVTVAGKRTSVAHDEALVERGVPGLNVMPRPFAGPSHTHSETSSWRPSHGDGNTVLVVEDVDEEVDVGTDVLVAVTVAVAVGVEDGEQGPA